MSGWCGGRWCCLSSASRWCMSCIGATCGCARRSRLCWHCWRREEWFRVVHKTGILKMADYRWDQLDKARGYDVAAEHVHPHYRELQDVILDALPLTPGEAGWVIDLGG